MTTPAIAGTTPPAGPGNNPSTGRKPRPPPGLLPAPRPAFRQEHATDPGDLDARSYQALTGEQAG